MTKVIQREFLQLAHPYNPAKHKIAGWLWSEKLDGLRDFWDGGITRGLPTRSVPWANLTDPKTGLEKKKIAPHATGLWSRYGNPIQAPDSFLNKLPTIFLDGELWAGRGKFQLASSICRGDEPDPRFDKITYMLYGAPSPERIFKTALIKNTNFIRDINFEDCWRFYVKRCTDLGLECRIANDSTFSQELSFIEEHIDTNEPHVQVHTQTYLSNDETTARQQLEIALALVLDRGGEGLIIRNPNAVWTPKRTHDLLKYKPFSDDEGTLIGFTSGRQTDKGSKLLGKIGALILDYKGKRLELSGLTDEEREFDDFDGTDGAFTNWAGAHPGKDMLAGAQGKHFKTGQQITFKYRELSDDGIPKEARYFRKREDE